MQNEQPEPLRRESDTTQPTDEQKNADGPERSSEEATAYGMRPFNSVSPGTRPSSKDADSRPTGETGEARGPERHESEPGMFARPSGLYPGPNGPETRASRASVSTGTHEGAPVNASTPSSLPDHAASATGNEDASTRAPGTSTGVPEPPRVPVPPPTYERYQPPVPLATAVPDDQATAQSNIDASDSQSSEPAGLLDLADSEEVLSEVDSGDDGRFVLTNHRLIYQGRSSGDSVFSSAAIADVTAIQFGRRERDSRSAWWGVVGLIAAVAVWQVTTNETVGAVAGAIVGGLSLLLLADYWFRPAGLVLRFGTAGGSVEGPVSNRRMRDAEQLAAMVQQLKQGSPTGSHSGPATPPGGSPGLS